MSRFHFMTVLLDCLLFEMAGKVTDRQNRCSLEDLADAYKHIRGTYKDNPGCFDLPCDQNIYLHKLNTIDGLRAYLNRLTNGHGPLYPYQTFVQSWYEDFPADDDFIYLPPLNGREIQDFLLQYAVTIPHTYHDDIAALIQAVREEVWRDRGSGGGYYMLDNGMRAAIKFSRVYNANKRAKAAQQQALELAAQQLRQQRQQQLAAEKQEQKRKHEEEVARILKKRLEEEKRQRELQATLKEQAEWNLLQIRTMDKSWIITEYLHKLDSQMATSGQKESVEALRKILESILRQHSGDQNVKVHVFGSFASGLCTVTSDVDFTVYNFARHYTNPIQEVAKAFRSAGCQSVMAITNARVPIVSFKARGFDCDATLDQPMAVLNSKLVKTYTKIDGRFAQLWLAVRQIAKGHQILSGSTGFLSSFALTMMLIVFLQDEVSPPILPRLQQQHWSRMDERKIDGYDCSFDHNWDRYRTFSNGNNESAAMLLIGFCRFYGFHFDYAMQEVNPRLGVIKCRTFEPAHNKTDKRLKVWPICIMDPFITDRNVAGNCRSNNVTDIQMCFRDAFSALNVGDTDIAFKCKV
ncbi:hypothetical protein EC957_008774 [Mortierella hygrophila]|uniref:polynucleotide adenylyltransferase n=1 Tax=Mortierella hygrophila TaxID=979708 RepID=A0A9P6EVY8_9FUNG|nr:hypothetical protein EC957_008774 [Mortierella hygrophila]